VLASLSRKREMRAKGTKKGKKERPPGGKKNVAAEAVGGSVLKGQAKARESRKKGSIGVSTKKKGRKGVLTPRNRAWEEITLRFLEKEAMCPFPPKKPGPKKGRGGGKTWRGKRRRGVNVGGGEVAGTRNVW